MSVEPEIDEEGRKAYKKRFDSKQALEENTGKKGVRPYLNRVRRRHKTSDL